MRSSHSAEQAGLTIQHPSHHGPHRLGAPVVSQGAPSIVCRQGGERAAERHCGRITLMCEAGNRARPDCPLALPSLGWNGCAQRCGRGSAFQSAASGRRSVIAGEVREAMNKSPQVCARARAGERPVSSLMCELGSRVRPDSRWLLFSHRLIGTPHIPIWGLGGAAAGFPGTTAVRRTRTRPTGPLAADIFLFLIAYRPLPPRLTPRPARDSHPARGFRRDGR